MTIYQVKISKRGEITLPRGIRDQYTIEAGGQVSLIDLGEGIVVMRLKTQSQTVNEIADRLAEEWKRSGETLESMLATLRQVRAEKDSRQP